MTGRPTRQVCPICGLDDDVEIVKADDEWAFTCSSLIHPPFEWRPRRPAVQATYRTGLGEELGVYDTLRECLTEEMCEYGIIEHRFALADPNTYTFLVKRYGHTAVGPRRYTTSSFLGGALGQLWREELASGMWGPATGYWSYNSRVGAYAVPEASEQGPITSWADFASAQLGVDPGDWPALGYHHGT